MISIRKCVPKIVADVHLPNTQLYIEGLSSVESIVLVLALRNDLTC